MVSSGYGVVAAEVGGLTEQRILRVKSGDTTGSATLHAGAQVTRIKVLALLVQVGAPRVSFRYSTPNLLDLLGQKYKY